MVFIFWALNATFLALIWFVRYSDGVRRLTGERLRPSLTEGMIQILAGLYPLSIAFLIPRWMTVFPSTIAFQFIVSMVAATCIAIGVDNLLDRRDVEPANLPDGELETTPKSLLEPPRRLTLSLIGMMVAMLVLCVCLAVFAGRFRQEKEAQRKHDQAIARIIELGGTVQQNSVAISASNSITLSGTSIVDDDLMALTNVRNLRELNLGATAITNEGLKHLESMHDLDILILSGTSIDDAGLKQLSGLTNLRTLSLRKTLVTGTSIPISEYGEGMFLDLSLCPVTCVSLAILASRNLLSHLSLAQTDVDDTSLAELAKLAPKTLDISETNITAAGYEKLKSKMPETKIRWSARK